MRRLLVFSLVAVLGCGGKDVGPDLVIKLARPIPSGAPSGTCPTPESGLSKAGLMRLTVRRNLPGGAAEFCDALFSGDTKTPFSFPLNPGEKLDFFAEAFGPSPDGATMQRLAAGAIYNIDPGTREAPVKALPDIVLLETELFSCMPGLALLEPRALHTATTLKDGTVIIVGGMHPDQRNNQQYILTTSDTVEVYDPVKRAFVKQTAALARPRALHSAVVVADDGVVAKILVVGGLTSSDLSKPVLAVNITAESGEMRLTWSGSAAGAPIEALQYDRASGQVTQVPAGIGEAAFHSSGFQGVGAYAETATGPAKNIVAVGGFSGLPGGTANLSLDVSKDLTAVVSAVLPEKRIGPGVFVPSEAQAFVIGGGMEDMMTMKDPPAAVRYNIASAPPAPTTPMISGGTLPMLWFPTLATLAGGATPAFVIAGGLEHQAGQGAKNPPARLPMVIKASGTGDLTVEDVKPGQGTTTVSCTAGDNHYRPTAYNAALTIPGNGATAARVLITGGSPRSQFSPACQDCDVADNTTECALAQTMVIDTKTNVMTPGLANLGLRRWGHTMSLLPDGTVLVVGGITRRANDKGQFLSEALRDVELLNSLRRTPVESGDGPDADDPILNDLKNAALIREAGVQAHLAGDPTPRKACALLEAQK